jgi:hypothetical protein
MEIPTTLDAGQPGRKQPAKEIERRNSRLRKNLGRCLASWLGVRDGIRNYLITAA